MRVAIIDCGAGNLHSVRKAFATQLAATDTLEIVTDAAQLKTATHIVLPGVGAFADCMAGLSALPGMRDALEEQVLAQKKPFLGICVGMQMLFERGHEHGVHTGLDWFKGEVAPLAPNDPSLRIPHMGWNSLRITNQKSKITNRIAEGTHMYFVHSYAAHGVDADIVLAQVDYGGPVVALIGRGNVVASQFHPEKSQRAGLALIHNFLEMEP
ncbi:MAG: imidazole glycerol phosphate synthase subunit HisH [Rickettsiales bacterium]